MTFEQIKKEAMALTDDERADLADALVASLDIERQRRIEEAWVEEIERRIDDLDAGRTTIRPAGEVMRELRAKFSPPTV